MSREVLHATLEIGMGLFAIAAAGLLIRFFTSSHGSEGKPIGLTYVGLAWPCGVISRSVHWFGSRTEIQSRCSLSALNLLRLWLVGDATR